MCTSAGLYFTGVYHIVLGTLVWENWAVRETLIYVLLHCIICVLNVNFGLFILWALNWIPLSLYCCYLCCTGALYDVALLYMSGLLYMLYCMMQSVLYNAALYGVQCCTAQRFTVWCCTVRYMRCTVWNCTARRCTVLFAYSSGLGWKPRGAKQ